MKNCPFREGWISVKGKSTVVILFIGLSFLLCHCAHFSGQPQEGEEQLPVLFTYLDGNAKKVCIAGTFNQWSPQSDCMVQDVDKWSLKLLLYPGRYLYLFVIDDHIWRPDPGPVLVEESGFGTKNSVLIVE